MYLDDPRAEDYDKHGRYYPKETHVIQSSSMANFDTMSESIKEGDYNLFHRGNRQAQLKQLEHMGYKSDFFSRENVNYSKSGLKRRTF